MWYYLPEWLKFWKRWRKDEEDRKLSDIIKRRAEEQNAVIDRKIEEIKETEKFQSVGYLPDKDFFE